MNPKDGRTPKDIIIKSGTWHNRNYVVSSALDYQPRDWSDLDATTSSRAVEQQDEHQHQQQRQQHPQAESPFWQNTTSDSDEPGAISHDLQARDPMNNIDIYTNNDNDFWHGVGMSGILYAAGGVGGGAAAAATTTTATTITTAITTTTIITTTITTTTTSGGPIYVNAPCRGYDIPYFASNLRYYPHLPQPLWVAQFETYADFKINGSRASRQIPKPPFLYLNNPGRLSGIPLTGNHYSQRRSPNALNHETFCESSNDNVAHAASLGGAGAGAAGDDPGMDVWLQMAHKIRDFISEPDGELLFPINEIRTMGPLKIACLLISAHLVENPTDEPELIRVLQQQLQQQPLSHQQQEQQQQQPSQRQHSNGSCAFNRPQQQKTFLLNSRSVEDRELLNNYNSEQLHSINEMDEELHQSALVSTENERYLQQYQQQLRQQYQQEEEKRQRQIEQHRQQHHEQMQEMQQRQRGQYQDRQLELLEQMRPNNPVQQQIPELARQDNQNLYNPYNTHQLYNSLLPMEDEVRDGQRLLWQQQLFDDDEQESQTDDGDANSQWHQFQQQERPQGDRQRELRREQERQERERQLEREAHDEQFLSKYEELKREIQQQEIQQQERLQELEHQIDILHQERRQLEQQRRMLEEQRSGNVDNDILNGDRNEELRVVLQWAVKYVKWLVRIATRMGLFNPMEQ